MINSQNIDTTTGIRQLITASAVGIVPSGDCGGSSDVGEVLEGALSAVALGEETVGSVRTGYHGEGAGGIIVAGVVGYGDGEGAGGHGEEGGDAWELHFDWCLVGWLW